LGTETNISDCQSLVFPAVHRAILGNGAEGRGAQDGQAQKLHLSLTEPGSGRGCVRLWLFFCCTVEGALERKQHPIPRRHGGFVWVGGSCSNEPEGARYDQKITTISAAAVSAPPLTVQTQSRIESQLQRNKRDDAATVLVASQSDPIRASQPIETGHRRGLSRTATGVRLRRSGNNSWTSGPITASPNRHPLAPGPRPPSPGLEARQGLGGMLSSLPIGPGRLLGPTALYIRTPLPRVRQDCRPLAISTSRSPSLVSPVFPSRKWIVLQPTLPNWSQLPQPLSAHAPKPPDIKRRKKHLRTMKDPVARTDSPYTDPSVKGPRSQLLTQGPASRTANSRSSSAASHLAAHWSRWDERC
jgi:hypothetical protein